jgi:hypothetical protein
MVYRPPNHGILIPLPMEYWPPTYGISNPLLWYYELLSFGRNGGGFNLPWGGSKYNYKKLTPGSKYHMENWTRGQNIIGKSTPGSIYHGVQNTIWHREWMVYVLSKKCPNVQYRTYKIYMVAFLTHPCVVKVALDFVTTLRFHFVGCRHIDINIKKIIYE